MIPGLLKAGLGAVGGLITKHPVVTTAALGAAPLVGEALMTSPLEAYKGQLNRWYENVETHRPHDAQDAYNEDDFMRQAFAMSQDYKQYRKMLRAGGRNSAKDSSDEEFFKNALTEKEFNILKPNKKWAQRFVEGSARNNMRDVDNYQFGEGWEGKVPVDDYLNELAARRAMALQMFQPQEE